MRLHRAATSNRLEYEYSLLWRLLKSAFVV
jgi:hypothetical protein